MTARLETILAACKRVRDELMHADHWRRRAELVGQLDALHESLAAEVKRVERLHAPPPDAPCMEDCDV